MDQTSFIQKYDKIAKEYQRRLFIEREEAYSTLYRRITDKIDQHSNDSFLNITYDLDIKPVRYGYSYECERHHYFKNRIDILNKSNKMSIFIIFDSENDKIECSFDLNACMGIYKVYVK